MKLTVSKPVALVMSYIQPRLAASAVGAMASAARAVAAASAAFTRLSLSPGGSYVNPDGRIVIHGMGIAVAALALSLLVAFVVVAPLRRGPDVDRREDEKRAGLEAAKEAKYREIRDAELDFRMGKMTDSDYRQTDRELRAQAVIILRDLDELEAERR